MCPVSPRVAFADKPEIIEYYADSGVGELMGVDGNECIECEGINEELEGRTPKAVWSTGEPTREMMEEHVLAGHVPYRPWCEACVAGLGRAGQHRRTSSDREEEVPVVCMDYGCMGKGERELRG